MTGAGDHQQWGGSRPGAGRPPQSEHKRPPYAERYSAAGAIQHAARWQWHHNQQCVYAWWDTAEKTAVILAESSPVLHTMLDHGLSTFLGRYTPMGAKDKRGICERIAVVERATKDRAVRKQIVSELRRAQRAVLAQ